MPLSLSLLSKLLKLEITTIGDIRLICLNDTYVITEYPMCGTVEINNLNTYEAQALSPSELTDILNFSITRNLIRAEEKRDRTHSKKVGKK